MIWLYHVMRRNWILAYRIAFFDLDTRKVPASIWEMPACSLNGAHNEHESHCSKTVTQISMWLVSLRYKFCDRNWKVSLWLYKALERTCFSLTYAQNTSFKQQWVNKNVIRTVTRMDILTSRKTLRDHILLKFNVSLKTDTPENICAKNQASNNLLNKNRIKKVITSDVELCQLINRIIKNKAGTDNENSPRPCPGTMVRTATLMRL